MRIAVAPALPSVWSPAAGWLAACMAGGGGRENPMAHGCRAQKFLAEKGKKRKAGHLVDGWASVVSREKKREDAEAMDQDGRVAR